MIEKIEYLLRHRYCADFDTEFTKGELLFRQLGSSTFIRYVPNPFKP